MKLLVFFLAATVVCTHHLTENGFQISPQTPASFLYPRSAPYDKCFAEVEISSFHLLQIAKLIVEKRHAEIFREVTAVIIHVRKAVQCFIHPEGLTSAQVDPQCVLRLLLRASARLRFVLWDITNCNWSMAKLHFDEAMEILKDIKNC